jgi:2-polyprenyl-6-methoxyphenol hydroxylase-like FAD-dependent oxidoreductase
MATPSRRRLETGRKVQINFAVSAAPREKPPSAPREILGATARAPLLPVSTPRTALIVGAGIGGLSAGIALQRAGWHVRIFERSARPRELGFGLGLAPNAIGALAELGVADIVLARSFAPTIATVELRRPSGTVVKRADIPLAAALGGRMAIALRPALHGALLDAVGPDIIAVEKQAGGFHQTGDRVTVRLTNGDAVDGDLLVGADGIGSVIRQQMHPSEAPPRSSRIVAVRGAVHGALHHLQDLAAIYYLGPGIESMVVRASDTGIYWFVSLARELVPMGLSDPQAVLALMAPRFDTTFCTITGMTDDLRFDELFDRDPAPFWSSGRVTLLGDAAHPLLPHTGQGAAQAIVDAVTLGKALESDSDVASALQWYERERRGRTATLLAQGRRTARLMRTTNPLACALRELVIRMMPVSAAGKLYVRINRRAGTA